MITNVVSSIECEIIPNPDREDLYMPYSYRINLLILLVSLGTAALFTEQTLAQNPMTYSVTVTTAQYPANSKMDAGTQLWVVFHGEYGSTSQCQLNTIGYNDFELGSSNTFSCNLVDVGLIRRVELILKKSPGKSGQLDDWQMTGMTVSTSRQSLRWNTTWWLGDSNGAYYKASFPAY
jgi:hypothetical protein